MSATPTPQSDQAEQLANKIVTAFEGHFREWMMPGEHAEAVKLTKEVIEDSLGATQAATTPGRAEELAAWMESYRGHDAWLDLPGARSPYREAAALLRAQNAELLALRADKESSVPLLQALAAIPIEAFGWEKHRNRQIHAWNGHELRVGHVLDARAALNSPTQQSPAK